ncbi:MAG: DegV family protein [Bacilli bacterium]|nr:DegV family protein [Bacilli bacterium]
MYTFFTDTDCDITPAIASEYGIKIISMPYTIDDKDTYPYVDFETFEPEPFYELLRKGALPKTSALSPETYIKYFEPEFAAGRDILYVHFSEAMSGTYNSMYLAIEELKAKYPDRKFYHFDTKGITILSMQLVLDAAQWYKDGMEAEDILKKLEENVYNYSVYFYADNLKFFGRSGRVSGITAAMGGLLGIKPIIYMSKEGKMESIDKAIGKKKAIAKLLDHMEQVGDDIANNRILVASTGCTPLANELVAEIKKKYGENIDIRIIDINPTIGSHCGPDCTGVAFHSKTR